MLNRFSPSFSALALSAAFFMSAASSAQTDIVPSVSQSSGVAQARPNDVRSIDGLMRAYYEVVSGPAGQARDVARDRSLHHPDAQLMVPDRDADGRAVIRRMSVPEFHVWSAPVYAPGFYEFETRREVRRYGSMYHVFSYYDTRRTPDGPSIGRGINSIQLYFDGSRFWILSETWESESASLPLPQQVPLVD
ncbi:hypothetical protein KSF73_10695 [Burkholderiaceae bacterium DAT-1]|nr:hypothetical protein [Burkholderiaceae bacterium DAT-1]